MPDNRICSYCKQSKPKDMFYICQGRYRSHCKACTIKKNSRYQKETKPWLKREVDNEKTREYMKKYRAKNKRRFALYRMKFLEKNPGYFRDYYLEHKDTKTHKTPKNNQIITRS